MFHLTYNQVEWQIRHLSDGQHRNHQHRLCFCYFNGFRCNDKNKIKRKCPECQGNCSCQPCKRGKPKYFETKVLLKALKKGYTFVVSCLIVLRTDNLPFFILLTVYQDLVILSNFENEVDRVCDPEMIVNSNHESKFEASHQLHIIWELLRLLKNKTQKR